ncbi:MAG: four helix bundle protein [Deltaproteobacteria bacterium]|nr:four helix bundle protein [Deltaproteobacteria bacterium]
MTAKNYLNVEDLEVYKKLCRLHIEVCDLTHKWPQEEKYELGSQARRSSNSAPAQLAEKNDDRHIRNKIEGVNRGRGEAGETIHSRFGGIHGETQRVHHGKGVFRISESLQRMHSHAEWIGENIGAESSRARPPLAVSRGIGRVWRK